MNKKRNNKGFSLVELIVVIAVMAVLVVVLAPAYLRYVDKSRAQKDASAVGEVVNAINLSLADETVATQCKDGAEVVVGDNAEITVAKSAKLQSELQATIGKIDYSSNALDGKTVKISITKDGDSFKVKVTEPTGVDELSKLYS